MQEFIVVVKITVNTVEPVTAEQVKQEFLDEPNWTGGTYEVSYIEEINK